MMIRSSSNSSWDAGLQQLLQQGTITGYALVLHQGAAVACAHGCLAGDLWGAEEERGTPGCWGRAAQYHSAFHGGGDMPTHFDVCGQQAVVIRATDSSIYAVSQGKRQGVLAHYLPSGILITAFGKPHLPQTVAPQIEGICDRLRRP